MHAFASSSLKVCPWWVMVNRSTPVTGMEMEIFGARVAFPEVPGPSALPSHGSGQRRKA